MLSPKAELTLNYMRREAPRRGGFMYEGARPAYESGKYRDGEIDELLTCGAIQPHPDPAKGWVVSECWKDPAVPQWQVCPTYKSAFGFIENDQKHGEIFRIVGHVERWPGWETRLKLIIDAANSRRAR